MDILIVLLLYVSMTMGFTNTESADDTGVVLNEYNISSHCSVSVSTSEVRKYEQVKENAKKLLYVRFKYNGTQWDVIKVLDEKSKYLLTLGTYEMIMVFSLHTLRFGIEYIRVTSYTLSSGCLMDEISPTNKSILLVSNDFKTGCEDLKCLENISTTGPVCIQNNITLCSISNRNGEFDWERLRISDSTCFAIAIKLLFGMILGTVITFSRRFLFKKNLDSKLTMYTCIDFDGIINVENNNYLIEKQSVPCGILSILFDIYVPHFFPSVNLWFKGKAQVKSLSYNLSNIHFNLLFLLNMFLVFAIAIRTQLVTTGSCVPSFAFLLNGYVAITVVLAFKLITTWKRYRQTCWNWMKSIAVLISVFVWLIICLFISYILTLVAVFTLIGITTNCVPYVPLVLASIVNWLKISARLSNWYKCFFETVLDQVMSMIEEKALEVMRQSRKNCCLVVKSRSRMKIQDIKLLHVFGTPIFIDGKGNMKLTKTFFYRCLNISNERLQHNSLRISSDSVRQLICVNIFLFLIALIINSFGVIGHLSTSYLTLASLAGGVFPFLLDNFIVKDIPVSGITGDKMLKGYIEDLVNSYEESFVIEQCSQTELIDILCEQNGQPNLVSNGCELTTVRSRISPDGHEFITEPSNFMTEHIGEEGDTSEMDPLLSLKTCEDVKAIEEEGQKRNTELQGDSTFIDIK